MALKTKFPKHQTVAWWINQLSCYDLNAIVKVATNYSPSAKCLLSIYEGDEKKPTVWIDIGEPE